MGIPGPATSFLAALFLLWPVGPATAGNAPVEGKLQAGETARAVEVVDGDTLLLDDGWQVRLVGIQAPKLPLGRRNFKKWPLADESKAALEELALGRELRLAYGGQRIDRHGRRLAHLFRDDGLWIQGELLTRGMARVYSFPDNRAVVGEMLAAERSARQAGVGIWADPWYAVRGPDRISRDIGTFQVIEGRVVSAADVRGTVYLNFGDDWRKDFTVKIGKRDRRRFDADGVDPLSLEGRLVRVRGWLDEYNGPLIEATHPEQIEVLDGR